jgi:hypothetical protein
VYDQRPLRIQRRRRHGAADLQSGQVTPQRQEVFLEAGVRHGAHRPRLVGFDVAHPCQPVAALLQGHAADLLQQRSHFFGSQQRPVAAR